MPAFYTGVRLVFVKPMGMQDLKIGPATRRSHSSTSQLNLRRFCH